MRFFFSLYSFLVLERFLNKLHLFLFFSSRVMFLPNSSSKNFPIFFFLTVNLGYYCLQIDFKTLQLTRCSAVIQMLLPLMSLVLIMLPSGLTFYQSTSPIDTSYSLFIFFLDFVCVTLCRSLLIDILSLLAPQLDIYQSPLHSLPFLVLA